MRAASPTLDSAPVRESSAAPPAAAALSDQSPAGAVQLPLVPASLEVDPLLLAVLHLAAFLDVSEDDSVHPVAAGIALERVGAYVQRLDDDTIDALAEDLDALIEHAEAAAWPTATLEFLASFLENCGFAAETDDEADADGDEVDDADGADDERAGEGAAGDQDSNEGSRREPVR